MHKQLLILISLASLICCKSYTDKYDLDTIELKLDSVANNYIDNLELAGIIVGIAKQDSILFLKSYGYSDRNNKISLQSSASFEIGSTTKEFTAVAILQLAEKGLLSLNDNINEYLDFNTKEYNVTIEKLLNHTSGIKGCTELPIFNSLKQNNFNRDSLLSIIEKEPFDFSPGEAMIYNNTGYLMLGLIIEKVSKQLYQDYIIENIITRAGLNNTFFCDSNRLKSNNIFGYKYIQNKGLVRTPYLEPDVAFSGGALCSTVEDLLRWNYVLHETNLILGKKYYESLIEPSKLNNGTNLRYAKGLFVDSFSGQQIFGHGGRSYGFFTDSRYLIDDNLAIVVMMNTTGQIRPEHISKMLTKLIYSKSIVPKIQIFSGDVTELQGIYYGQGRGRKLIYIIDTNDNGNLIISDDWRTDTLTFHSENRWSDYNKNYYFIMDGNEVKELQVDEVYGYYVLEKQGY
jgi:CubicO group peptidase (beta-lactamase class C family)